MFSLIEFITNKDFAGNIVTPDKFQLLIATANIDHFRDKYGLPEEYAPGSPLPLERSDITRKNTDDLKALKVRLPNRTVTNGIISYPSDYVHLESIVYNYSKTINGVATSLPRPVEILREPEFASREGNYTKTPTTQNPCGIIRSDGVHVRPITISACDFVYYKFPRTPIFSYIEGDGFITYNASTSVELEWPEDEKIVIMRRCLEYIGVNLREADIVNYANTKVKEG
jgi:hypothetical protein